MYNREILNTIFSRIESVIESARRMKQAHAVFSLTAAAAASTNNSANGHSNQHSGLDLFAKHSNGLNQHSLINKEINNNNNHQTQNHLGNNVASLITPTGVNGLLNGNTSTNSSANQGLNLAQLGHFNQISEVSFQVTLVNKLQKKLFSGVCPTTRHG